MPAIVNERIDDALRTVLGDTTDTVFVVGPSAQVVETLIDVAVEIDDSPAIRLLGAEATLKDVLDDFIVASHAADLIDAGVLELRSAEAPPARDLVVTEEAITSLVVAGDTVAALETDDSDFVESAYAFYEDTWEDTDAFSLRTPPLSRVRETLGTDIGEAAREDFDAVLGSLETARGNGDGLDEVTISLLVAGRNGVLLYDISKWGEDIGLASKATFSRTKTRLEDKGLIDTEKVPIDVGRPRLRLRLDEDRLDADDVETMVRQAVEALAEP